MESRKERRLADRINVYFFPSEREELLKPYRDKWSLQTRLDSEFVRGSDDASVADGGGSGESPEELPQDNRQMIYENRQRIVRIDERTAFIARIIFGIFLALMVSIGGGVSVAYLLM